MKHKKMIVAFITVVFTCLQLFSIETGASAQTQSEGQSPKGVSFGDVDCSGVVNIEDVTFLQRLLADFEWKYPFAISDQMLVKIGDSNGNGKIDITDVTLIQNYLAGFSNTAEKFRGCAFSWSEVQQCIEVAAPRDVIEEEIVFSAVKPQVSAYLSKTEYNADNYKTSSVAEYCTENYLGIPVGYGIPLPENAKQILLYDVADQTGQSYTVSDKSEFCVQNLVPNRSYRYTLFDKNNNITCLGSIRANDSLRMIAALSCDNVRDLGGWSCDGGTVKYGKIFRGSKFAGAGGVTITETDITTMRDILGIRTEIDFQLPDEGGVQAGSPLGEATEYVPLPTNGYYTNMVDISKNTSIIKSALQKTFESVKNGSPVYFHCYYGADRTGTLAFVLENLLGVSSSDIDKDYELTCFSGIMKKRNGKEYKKMVTYFKGFQKNNMRDNVVQWALQLGITLEDINAFRASMIDGNPQVLTQQMF